MMLSVVRARRHAAGCRHCAAAGPIAWRRGCATICCAADSQRASSSGSCARRRESRQTIDRLPHAAARVGQLVDDGAVASDQLGAAELLDAATPLVDVLVPERFVPCGAAKGRLGGPAYERVAQERVHLTRLRVRRAREHAAGVRMLQCTTLAR